MSTRISATPAMKGSGRGWLAPVIHVMLGRPAFEQRGGMFAVALALQLAGAGLLGWISWVHWHLWQLGYKDIPTDGPFFLIDAISAILLAVALLAWRRPLTGLASAGFVLSTILGLVISLWVGLFGFHESISASYVVQSLVLESVAVVILTAWTVIAASRVHRGDILARGTGSPSAPRWFRSGR